MDDEIALSTLGLSHPQALCALFNAAKAQGLGAFHYKARVMTEDEAIELLKTQTYFDYHEGRVMKVKIEDKIRPRLYDRDNGEGAAFDALVKASSATRLSMADVMERNSKGT